MALSEETAATAANTLKVEFNLGYDVAKVAPTWQQRLSELGVTDTDAPGLLRTFITQWTSTMSPRLHDLCAWIGLRRPQPTGERRQQSPHPGRQRYDASEVLKRMAAKFRTPKPTKPAEDQRRRQKLRQQAAEMVPDYDPDLATASDVPDGEIPF